MYYRRSLTTSARLLVRQRLAPAFSCTHHEHDHKNLQQHSDEKASFLQSRSFGNNTNTWLGFGGGGGRMSFGDPKQSQFLPVTTGLLLARNMSTMNGDGDGDAEEKIGCLADLAEKTMEVVSSHQAAAVSEVSVAAAESWPPVAALQHVIDGIHIYTGLNWWASIVIATLVIKSMSIPLMIRTSKILDVMKFLRERDAEYERKENYIRVRRLLRERNHFYQCWTVSKKLFIQGTVFVCFYRGIENMVEKVPSFQKGGILWFTDLTAIDSSRVVPFLAAISFWSYMLDCSKGDPNTVKMKYGVFLLLSALTTPLTANFPNALLCYWITNNFFNYAYNRMINKVIKKSLLREWELLNMPLIQHPPPSVDYPAKAWAAESKEKLRSEEHESDSKI